jgi:hypothetical protein
LDHDIHPIELLTLFQLPVSIIRGVWRIW